MSEAAGGASSTTRRPPPAPSGCCRLAREASAAYCAALLPSADGNAAFAEDRLARLVEHLWPEVQRLMRREAARGLDTDDLTQAYFARFIEKGYVRQLESWHGCIRPFLATSVRHFAANARDHARALKRGGRLRRVPLDHVPETAWLGRPPHCAETPESRLLLKERRRAVARAVSTVRAEMGDDLRRLRFEALLRLIVDGGEAGDLARAWGVRPVAVRVAAHRLRRRLAAAVALRSRGGETGRAERKS